MHASMCTCALFIGRFQPFHRGHMSALQDILQTGYDHVVLIVGSANISRTDNNPWTYTERELLIRTCLVGEL